MKDKLDKELDLDYADEFMPTKPYTIVINEIEWIVQEINPDTALLNGNRAFAVCNVREKTIYISNDLNQDFKKQALIHELTHAFVFSYLLEVTNEFNEEELCHFVTKYSPQINQIANEYFKDKPTLESVVVGTPKPRIPTAPCPKPKSVSVGDGSRKGLYDHPNTRY